MKHGPINLISAGFQVTAIATKGPVYEKAVSSLQEFRARSTKTAVFSTEDDLCCFNEKWSR